MTRRRQFQRGSTIVLVTTIGVIVGILAMAMAHLGFQSRVLSVRNVQGIQARAAADAGMVDAIFKMQKKLIDEPTWDNDSLPSATDTALEGANCTFSYTIAGNTGAGWQIDSTGVCAGQSRTTHVRLAIGTYWEGIGVQNVVDVKVNTAFGVINGVPSDMTIRTNSTAADALGFKAFVTVPGDVLCGPGGDPETVIDVKATTVITGQTYAASEPILFPPVPAPLGTTYVSTPITTTTTISGGSYQYDTINLGNGQVLTINGPTVLYVTGTTTLNNSAEIVVAEGGSLELYLGGNLVNQNSVGFSNLTDNSVNLKIYGLPGCTSMDLKAKSTLYAAVYAPSAAVNLYNTGDFYGAITADSFYMKNSGTFYFDRSLMSTTIDDAAAVFTIARWWEG
jgi:hypothetical protein